MLFRIFRQYLEVLKGSSVFTYFPLPCFFSVLHLIFDRMTMIIFVDPSGNFLFSLKDSSSSKFNETSDSGGTSAVLTETGLSFGGDELTITWNGPPEVKNVLGNVFAITDLDSMVGVDEFTADDFEVLQPKGSRF